MPRTARGTRGRSVVGNGKARRWLVAALTLALVAMQFTSALPFISSFVPAHASAASVGTVYVGSQSGTVAVVDPATNTVTATIDLGGGGAYGVAVRPGGGEVWVANYNASKIQVIDTSTNTISKTATVAGNPHSIAFNPSGDRAYVSVDNGPTTANSVWIFDATQSPPFAMATVPTTQGPTGVTMRPDGKALYVAGYAGDVGTTVDVIDTTPNSGTQNQKIATVTVGTGPFQIAITSDSARAYVMNRSSANVSVINTATNTVVATIAVDSGPVFGALNRTGSTLSVTNIDTGDISVIDTATNTVTGTITGIGTSPRGIALSPDDARAYVATDRGLDVIGAGGTLVTTVTVGAQPFFVAVLNGSQIGGIAQCANPVAEGTVLMTSATVDLFSGSARVGTTASDATTAAYSFVGTAPNTKYTLVYTKSFFRGVLLDSVSLAAAAPSGFIRCSTSVTTDGTGGGTGGTGSTPADRHNHTWVSAYDLSGSPITTDFVFQQGQSTWFKIPVAAGQRVNVKLTNVPADYSLALYKDIRQLYDKAVAALNGGTTTEKLAAINRLDAAVAPDALSPDELSPDALSPDALSPDALSPDALSPDALSPDALSPDELSPDELSPDALSPDALSPDALSPDALSPDALSPDALSAAYAGAQTAALIGVSAHVGLSPEQIARNTWDNTGSFYMRVRGHNGVFDASAPFTISVSVIDVSCPAGTLNPYPVTYTAPAAATSTLILWNSARIAGTATDISAFGTKLAALGTAVDLNTIPALASAYGQWDTGTNASCPAAANIVAHGVKSVIDAYAATNPLRYIVIAGNDHAVPFYRLPDQSGLGSEKDYFPAVRDPTASQASLRSGYVLTQDYYASRTPISRFDHELYLPDLAIGRLVETIPQMTAVIDAYNATSGRVAPTSALVTGYDFLADAASTIAARLATGVTTDSQLIQPGGETPTGPNAWTATQLRAKLFGPTTYGILSLNAHFSGNTMLASDFATRLLSSEITSLPATDTRFKNALVLSTGCHSGYNIVDGEATALTQPADWAQAFASRGATLVGGTGYQYGDTDFMKYSELILANTVQELRYDSGAIKIGTALANAKRAYVSGLATLSGIDEKALAEATLYGLPMLGYELPASARTTRTPVQSVPAATALNPDLGLSVATFSPAFTLNPNTRALTVLGGTTTQPTTYYDINGNVAVAPGKPVLPQLSANASQSGMIMRGAVMLSAHYDDVPNAVPFTDVATTELRGAHARFATDVFWPVRPFTLNQLGGSTFVSTPYQFRSNPTGTAGTARLLSSQTFNVYYSSLTDARALASAPTVFTVTLTPNTTAGTVDVLVLAGGISTVAIEKMFATYTGEAGALYGNWNSVELTRGGTIATKPVTTTDNQTIRVFVSSYSGSIPLGAMNPTNPNDVRAFIQAVGGNGLVTWATNDGAYYRVVNETASISHPKTATAVTLSAPASGAYRSTVPVSATLTTATGTPLANKPVAFRSGGIRVDATTNSSGVATGQLFLTSAPGPATVSVGFAEDADDLGSGADAPITITKASSSFITPTTTVLSGGSVLIATLVGAGQPLGGQLVTLNGAGKTVQSFTDGYGRVRIDTLDGFPTGGFSVNVTYDGNDRYQPASSLSVSVPNTFVTSGGWIITPADALNLVVGKKTNFNLDAKYKTGDTVPTGAFLFQAKESNVTFRATSFDLMSVSGSTATVSGVGTVNGAGTWYFRATVTEGAAGAADTLTVSIWKTSTPTGDPYYRASAPLAGGNVVVHS